MNASVPADDTPNSNLAEISTRWAIVGDPLQFVLRYATAIQKYLTAMVPNAHDADEIAQDFLLKMMERRFEHVSPDRGRFRFYLKQAIRNAVREHARWRRPTLVSNVDLAEYATDETADSLAEQQWVEDWRRCILDRAWTALESHQRRHEGNLCHTVLRLTAEQPDADSATLAGLAARQSNRPLSVEAFRQQVSRGRRLLATFIQEEVAATLERPVPDDVNEELLNLGLMEYVGPYLPPDGAE
jgi:RNA polymerase sigma factor (sigma-70 family)